MFSDEVEYAKELNSKLSFGIGIFQGLSNLFVNGVVLGVIFAGNELKNSKKLLLDLKNNL